MLTNDERSYEERVEAVMACTMRRQTLEGEYGRDKIERAAREMAVEHCEAAGVPALVGELRAERTRTETLTAALDESDRIFYGWSFDDVFNRVEKLRLHVRAALAASVEEPPAR